MCPFWWASEYPSSALRRLMNWYCPQAVSSISRAVRIKSPKRKRLPTAPKPSPELAPISNHAVTVPQGRRKLCPADCNAIDSANASFVAPRPRPAGTPNNGSSSLRHDTHRHPIRYCAYIGLRITLNPNANVTIAMQPTSSRISTSANSRATSPLPSKPQTPKDTSRNSPSQPHQSRQKRETSQTTSKRTRHKRLSLRDLAERTDSPRQRRIGSRRRRKKLLPPIRKSRMCIIR
jgi:hypothetical protein